jgi:hypothetical protein
MAISKLKQSSVTLALLVLVLLTIVHAGVVAALKATVASRLTHWQSGPTRLTELERPLHDGTSNAAPYYEAAVQLCRPNEKAPGTGYASNGQSATDYERDFIKVVTQKWTAGPSKYVGSDVVAGVAAEPAAAERVVKAYAASFDMLDRAYSQPQCNYRYLYRFGFRSQPAPFLYQRRLAQIIAVRLNLDIARHDMVDLNQTASHSLRWIRTLEPDDNLMGLIIRIGCSSYVLTALEQLSPGSLSPETRAELLAFKNELPDAWERARTGERLSTLELYDQLLSGKATLDEVVDPRSINSNSGGLSMPARIFYKVGGQPLILLDELCYLNALIDQTKKWPQFTIASAFYQPDAAPLKQINTTSSRLAQLLTK